jgi:hypothetical protein
MESDGLMDADESECKRIRVINCVLAPEILKRYFSLVG